MLTLETFPHGAFTHQNHIDMAVSQTADPTGTWNIFRFDVTNDGTNTGGVNPGPYLGDYPHIGADANGVYITTNSYPWLANGFAGAQIYALSKAQLAAGASTVTMAHVDTSGMVPLPSDAGAAQPGFTVWPAQSPGTGSFETAAGGTEYFLSSNAADEATHPVAGFGGSYVSDKVIVWALANTSSLDTSTPAVSLSTKVLGAEQYAIPPRAQQPGAGTAPTKDTPQGYCINDTTTQTIAGTGCWKLLFGAEPAHHEVISRPDSNDTRMQQVMYANGKLWGALDTALNPDGGAQRAGIAWFIVKPSMTSGSLSTKMAMQGYLGAGRDGPDLPRDRCHRERSRGDGLHLHRGHAVPERRLRVHRRPRRHRSDLDRGQGQGHRRRLHELQGPGRRPAPHPLGRLQRGRRRRQLGLDRERVHRQRV